jgi:hypothetical protein
MKIINRKVKVETGGDLGAGYQMGISKENEVVIMDILRDKMYKHPIAAICREISCNAKDSHVEAGKPEVPVEIVLPNTFHPYLEIKDKGTGISEDRVRDVFVNLGASTKRDDMAQIGAFGLGSKTPFAYSQSFSVETVFEGERTVYGAYIDESRKGMMQIMSREKTDEENGTTIKVPVKQQDFEKFANEVYKAVWFWDVKPIIDGKEWKWSDKYDYAVEGDNWFVDPPKLNAPSSIRTWLEQPIAIVGNMPFAIDFSSLGSLPDNVRRMKGLRVRFRFPIGGLSLPANRESLHYDSRTTAVLKKTLAQLGEHFLEKANKALDTKAKNLLDAILVAHTSLDDVLRAMNGIIKRTDLKYKNFDLDTKIKLKFPCQVNIRRTDGEKINKSVYGEYYPIIADSELNIRIPKRSYDSIGIYFNDFENTNRVPPNIWEQIKADDNSPLYCYFITPMGNASYEECCKQDEAFKALEIPKLSTLYKKVSNKKAKTGVKTGRTVKKNEAIAYKYDKEARHGGRSGVYFYTNKTKIDLDNDSGVYCELRLLSESTSACDVRLETFKVAAANLLGNKSLYVVKPGIAKRLEKRSNWEHINALIEREAKVWVKKWFADRGIKRIAFAKTKNYLTKVYDKLEAAKKAYLRWNSAPNSTIGGKCRRLHSSVDIVQGLISLGNIDPRFKEYGLTLKRLEQSYDNLYQFNLVKQIANLVPHNIEQYEGTLLFDDVLDTMDTLDKELKEDYPVWYLALGDIYLYKPVLKNILELEVEKLAKEKKANEQTKSSIHQDGQQLNC